MSHYRVVADLGFATQGDLYVGEDVQEAARVFRMYSEAIRFADEGFTTVDLMVRPSAGLQTATITGFVVIEHADIDD